MNWKNKLQASVQGLNANLSDSAARLRQQLLQPSGQVAGAPQQQQQQQQGGGDGSTQYVRLPIDSAKKLRWYDKADLNMLIQLHLREKQELFEANAALRQALARRGVSESALEAEVALACSHVDRLKQEDAAVGEVLAVAAQAEVERLREQVDSLSVQLEHMRQRVREAAAASAQQQQQAGERQPGASSAAGAGPSRPATPSTAAAAAAAAAASAGLSLQQQAAQQGERVVLQLDFAPTDGGSGEQEQQGPLVRVQLRVLQPPASSAATAPAGAGSPALLASLLRQLVAVAASTAGESLAGAYAPGAAGFSQPQPDVALLHQAQASLARLAAQQGVSLAAVQTPAPSGSSTASASSAAKPADSTAAATAAPSAAAAAEVAALRERCASLEGSSTRLATELAAAQHEVAALQEAAERRAAEARGRAGAQQAHLQELLRVAQDGRLEAEARCEAGERRVALAEARAARLDSDVRDLRAEAKRCGQEAKRLERELQAAEARAALADSALQKARGSAEADARSVETIAALRQRITELEGQLGLLQRQLAAARHQCEATESRLTAAEVAAAQAAAELHEAEGVAAERDALARRLAALEARMDETRLERGQLESYRAVAFESEAKRARAEEELVTTARLAATLEAQLVAAQARVEQLQLELAGAEASRLAAVQSVGREVEARWAAAGADRSRWPPVALEEMENLEARIAAVMTALKTTQAQAEEEAAGRKADKAQLAAAEQRAASAEEGRVRQEREWQSRERALESAVTASTAEVAELRRAVAELGGERDKLLDEKRARERAAQQAAAAIASARRRTGSGSLAEPVNPALANGKAGAAATPGLLPASRSSSGDAPQHPQQSYTWPPLPSPLRGGGPPLRESLDATDLLYLKNVLLKFLDAHLEGRSTECEVLLPAVATLLRATPAEFKVLREGVERAAAGPVAGAVSSWFGSSSGAGGSGW